MTTQTEERIDKFLWTVRIFKSRSAATEACRKGRIMIAGLPVKPAHAVSEGSTIVVRKPPVTYTYVVTGLPRNRVGAKLLLILNSKGKIFIYLRMAEKHRFPVFH